MFTIYNNLLRDIIDSEDFLDDVIGYFVGFEEDDSSDLLIAISFIFCGKQLIIQAQDDDSFTLFKSGDLLIKDQEVLKQISMINKTPWSLIKGKPLLWSWMLYNQFGYFDGIQMEFAKDSQDKAWAFQLMVLGGEIHFRHLSEVIKLRTPR